MFSLFSRECVEARLPGLSAVCKHYIVALDRSIADERPPPSMPINIFSGMPRTTASLARASISNMAGTAALALEQRRLSKLGYDRLQNVVNSLPLEDPKFLG